MNEPTIRYYSYPRTDIPPSFTDSVADVFKAHVDTIGTQDSNSGLKSNEVLDVVRSDLQQIGFDIEASKRKADKIERPVLFGEDGEPELKYEVDGYHEKWRCGLEVEAGRAWKGNAVYRDLIQATVMVQVNTLLLAVPNVYVYGGENQHTNYAFDNTKSVVDTLYASHRFDPPYDLILFGY